jgi:hypothetical protein
MVKKILFILFFLYILFYLLFSNNKVILNYPSSYNFRQTYNDCGPYSCFAVLKVLGKQVSIKEIKNNMKWRLQNNYTLPWGLEKLLKSHDVKIKKYNFILMSNDKKIEIIKKELAKGNPIIILGGINQYQHYLTILGYKSNIFFIYDSLQKADKNNKLTIDKNGNLPGNKNMSKNELLDFWCKGGKYNMFKWYALIAKK